MLGGELVEKHVFGFHNVVVIARDVVAVKPSEEEYDVISYSYDSICDQWTLVLREKIEKKKECATFDCKWNDKGFCFYTHKPCSKYEKRED